MASVDSGRLHHPAASTPKPAAAAIISNSPRNIRSTWARVATSVASTGARQPPPAQATQSGITCELRSIGSSRTQRAARCRVIQESRNRGGTRQVGQAGDELRDGVRDDMARAIDQVGVRAIAEVGSTEQCGHARGIQRRRRHADECAGSVENGHAKREHRTAGDRGNTDPECWLAGPPCLLECRVADPRRTRATVGPRDRLPISGHRAKAVRLRVHRPGVLEDRLLVSRAEREEVWLTCEDLYRGLMQIHVVGDVLCERADQRFLTAGWSDIARSSSWWAYTGVSARKGTAAAAARTSASCERNEVPSSSLSRGASQGSNRASVAKPP